MKYGIRHKIGEYQIYDIQTGKTVESFKHDLKELNRGAAHGRAMIASRKWNEKAVTFRDQTMRKKTKNN